MLFISLNLVIIIITLLTGFSWQSYAVCHALTMIFTLPSFLVASVAASDGTYSIIDSGVTLLFSLVIVWLFL